MPYTFGDIPDSRDKPYIPIMHIIWKLYLEIGWDPLKKIFDELAYNVYNLGFERLKNTVDTAKLIMEGKLDGTNIMNYSLSPPFYVIRNDLQAGSLKMLYGESCDSTFIICNTFDQDQEIGFLMNCHLEDGVPVDFWTVNKDDELMERRHLKLGVKLKDLPKKLKTYDEIGWKAQEILQDVRNERTPQWTTSAYFTGACRMTGVMNCLLEISNYELFFHLYNSYNTKRLYKLDDLMFSYTPFPSLLYTATFMSQYDFILRTVGLTTGLNWALQGWHESNITYFQNEFAEMWDILVNQTWLKDGIPMPQMTLNWRYPYIKEKKDYVKKFSRTSEKKTLLTLDQLDIPLEDAYKGIFLDFTPEDDPQSLSSNNIISIGMGKDAKVLKEHIRNTN
ncbi:MAG: hypothetical protein ACTSQI_04395 [Candidatus Helarchaeota archaeon]